MGKFANSRKIICENSYGYKLEFSYHFPFYLDSYNGIHEYSGSNATAKSAFGVGVTYIGTSVNQRNITLIVAFEDDDLMQVHRDQIYNIFPLKDRGTLYFYEGTKERKINYYVDDVVPTFKGRYLYYTISLMCPDPYFMDINETKTSIQKWDKLFEFKLEITESGIEFGSKNESTSIEIENNSHIDYGLTITFSATGDVENPGLENKLTGETLKLNYQLKINEKIVVTTFNNNKKIIFIDSNGYETNITNSIVFGSKFLQAVNGVNKYVATADEGLDKLDVNISYSHYYEAV